MDKFDKKIATDLFASPWSLGPLLAGITSIILTWGLKLPPIGFGLGIIGIATGIGVFFTRLIFGREEIAQRAIELVHEAKREDLYGKLDDLNEKLKTDRDKRTGECLRSLRQLHESYVADKEQTNEELRTQVEAVFYACIKHLEKSFEMWEDSRKLNGQPKQDLLNDRNKVVAEIVTTIEHLGGAIREFHSFSVNHGDDELSALRKELDLTMRAARKTEEWERNLTSSTPTKEYE